MTIGKPKASTRQLCGHTTRDEIKFVRGLDLGTLRDYYQAAKRRGDWAGMDGAMVLEQVGERIALLETQRIDAERKPGRPSR